MRVAYLLAAPVLVLGVAGANWVSVPSASADCVSSGGTTLCSQGDARGADTGDGPSSGVYAPYSCNYDWYCSDDNWGWGWDVDIDVDPGRPGRPGIGRR